MEEHGKSPKQTVRTDQEKSKIVEISRKDKTVKWVEICSKSKKTNGNKSHQTNHLCPGSAFLCFHASLNYGFTPPLPCSAFCIFLLSFQIFSAEKSKHVFQFIFSYSPSFNFWSAIHPKLPSSQAWLSLSQTQMHEANSWAKDHSVRIPVFVFFWWWEKWFQGFDSFDIRPELSFRCLGFTLLCRLGGRRGLGHHHLKVEGFTNLYDLPSPEETHWNATRKSVRFEVQTSPSPAIAKMGIKNGSRPDLSQCT